MIVPAGTKFYHGSRQEFSEFKCSRALTFGVSEQEVPIFLTPDIEFAKAHGHKLYTVTLKIDLNLFCGADVGPEYPTESRYFPPEYESMYPIGKQLFDDLYDGKIFPQIKGDEYECREVMKALMLGYYSSVEDNRFCDWLKDHGFDGAFVIESQYAEFQSIFVFNPAYLRIT